MSFADELRRRSVFRVAAAYLVVGWLLTEVLTTILPELGAPPWAARTVILLFALGFVPTVVLSWIYEITPEGIQRESELADGHRRTHGTFDYAIIATVFVLVVALAVLGARTASDDAPESADVVSEASLAVLPFVNMSSSEEDNEYFSDGLTETLLHMLAQVPELKVAARTSSFAFKGQNKHVSEIARDLKVAHILEGSVQKSGNRVRITAQLIRAEDGFHVWSQSFNRTFDDIFMIQDEIAIHVSEALTASLLGSSPTTAVAGIGTQNADAYNLYMQALHLGANLSYGGLRAAENMLEAALETDPGYVDAKVQLAMNYLEQRATGLLASADALDRIEALTSEALAERPDDPLAEALNLFSNVIRHDISATPETFFDSIDGLEALVAANPGNSQISVMLADLLVALQRYERALEVLLGAVEQDGFNARLHFEVGLVYSLMGRLEESRAATARSLELRPNQPSAYMLLSRLARLEGDGVEVVRQLLNALNEDPRDHELPGDIGLFLYGIGLFEAGDDFRNLVIAMAPESEHALLLDVVRGIKLGDLEAADAAARHAIESDIGTRRGGFPRTILFLMREGLRNGDFDEVTAWLEATVPGIFDIGATAVTSKYRQAQVAAIEPWHAALPHDEFVERTQQLLGIASDFGLDPTADPNSKLAIQLMTGDAEGARRTALAEVFTQPVTRHLDWKRVFAQPLYREFAADAEVRAALARWQEQYDVMQDNVAAYLASLSSEE